MKLFQAFERLWNPRLIHGTSSKLARRVSATVSGSVGEHVLAMTLAEARGYIRGKATPVILREVDSLIRAAAWNPADRSELVERTNERIVQSILADVRGSRQRSARLGRAA